MLDDKRFTYNTVMDFLSCNSYMALMSIFYLESIQSAYIITIKKFFLSVRKYISKSLKYEYILLIICNL